MTAPTMLFSVIRPAILALVNRVMGQQGDCLAIWRDQPVPYTPPGTKTLFKLSTTVAQTKGWGDRRISYDPTQANGQELLESVVEYRKFTVKILCECSEQTDVATAANYLETLRTRLAWTSSVRALLVVNVAIIGDSPLQDLSRTVDNRALSSASYDLQMATVAVEADVANRFGYIDSVDPPTGTLT